MAGIDGGSFSSGDGISPSNTLHVMLMREGDVIVSMLDRQLYVCSHSVAMGSDELAQEVLRIVRETAPSLCDGILCEVKDEGCSSADTATGALIDQIKSEVNFPVNVVTPENELARVLNGTSESCRYSIKSYLQFTVEQSSADGGGLVGRAYESAMGLPIKNHTVQLARVYGGKQNKCADEQVAEETAAAPSECLVTENHHSDRVSNVSADADDLGRENWIVPMKRPRQIWDSSLHKKFTDAVEKLGDKAFPKKILQEMNVPGLTRAHISSHLQKYRQTLKKEQNKQPDEASMMHMSSNNVPTNVDRPSIPLLMPAPSSEPVRQIPRTANQPCIQGWDGRRFGPVHHQFSTRSLATNMGQQLPGPPHNGAVRNSFRFGQLSTQIHRPHNHSGPALLMPHSADNMVHGSSSNNIEQISQMGLPNYYGGAAGHQQYWPNSATVSGPGGRIDGSLHGQQQHPTGQNNNINNADEIQGLLCLFSPLHGAGGSPSDLSEFSDLLDLQ